ncbi:MAG: TetR family transcriptional regulator [Dehalococcoidia bacterium]|nr:TetR family transcriptional regulator [Dehalococcoidia bacterium]
MSGAHRPRRSPGRPRAEGADAAILRATIEVVAEGGMSAFTMDAVAARAGVAKTTIYRRWDTKEALIVDAVRRMAAPASPIDTGSLRGDLEALGAQMVTVLAVTPAGRLIPALVGELAHNEELAVAFRLSFVSERRAIVEAIAQRAKDRGEIAAGGDTSLLPELLAGPMFMRLLLTGDPIDEPFVGRLVERVLAAFEAR